MSEFGSAEMELVRNLVRRVDKNLEHLAKLAPDGENVVVSLKQGKLKGEVRFPLDALREAEDSLANAEALRQRIKRARLAAQQRPVHGGHERVHGGVEPVDLRGVGVEHLHARHAARMDGARQLRGREFDDACGGGGRRGRCAQIHGQAGSGGSGGAG